MTNLPVLRLQDVVKRYGSTTAVGPVSFSVGRGELLTLLGPSGCGKTTTLHVIAGLIPPTEGRVVMNGQDVTAVEPPQRDMGVVFQNYALFPHKSVYDNVAFGLRMRRVPRNEIRDRVRQVLDVVGLPGMEERYPHQLSGGQRQRVAVARAVVIEPSVLLLDEPLSNLDALLRKRMRVELREIQQRLGITTIFVTHDQDEAFEMSDRVILLNRGLIEQAGTPETLYDRPVSRFAAEFIGETNLVEGWITATGDDTVTVEVGDGARFEAPKTEAVCGVGAPVFLMIRPERVTLRPEPPANGTALAARVKKRVFSGNMIAFTIKTDDGIFLVSRKPSIAAYREIGAEERVWVVPEECRVLPRERIQ